MRARDQLRKQIIAWALGSICLLLVACAPKVQTLFPEPAQVIDQAFLKVRLIEVQPRATIQGEGIILRQVTVVNDRGRNTTYTVSGTLMAEDEAFRFTLGLVPMNILERRVQEGKQPPLTSIATVNMLMVGIENKTGKGAEIHWDQAGLWIGDHRPMRVVHKGVEFADIGKPMAPTVVPPRERVEEFLFPASLIQWNPDRKEWGAQRFIETLTVGERVYLLLPMKLDTMWARYRFTLEIAWPGGEKAFK